MSVKKVIKTIVAMVMVFTMSVSVLPAYAAACPADACTEKAKVEPADAFTDITVANSEKSETYSSNRNYVEGEVIALVRSDSGFSSSTTPARDKTNKDKKQQSLQRISGYECEELMSLSDGTKAENASPENPKDAGNADSNDDANEQATPKTNQKANRANVPDSDSGRIVLIKDKKLTTKELIKKLSKDESVIFAEPNYIYNSNIDEKAEDTPGQLSSDVADTTAGNPDQHASIATDSEIGGIEEYAGDASSAQYAYGTGDVSHFKDADSSMHIPNWNQPSGNMDQDVIVAVVDSGVDWTHPEFAGKIVTFDDEQQKALGCGRYGYNTIPDEPGNAMDDTAFYAQNCVQHGTHCAGIVGAAWDGQGISGAASRAKILNIRVIDQEGYLYTSAVIRAYSFIKKAYELGIKAKITSNSWFIGESSMVTDVAIRDLGENYGILSFFAGCNFSDAIPNMPANTSNLANNPYVIIVGASDIHEKISDYNCYSKEDAHILAPGSGILSTVGFDNCDKKPSYFPDLAPRGTNVFYAGAENEGELSLTVSGTSATVATTDQVSFFGKKSYMITSVDPIEQKQVISVISDVKKLAKPADFDDNYRCAFSGITSGDDYYSITVYVRNTTGDWEEVHVDSHWIYSDWGKSEFILPEDTCFDAFQLRIDFTARTDGPFEVYLDSFGIGNTLSKYGLKDGTSMATPAAAGAAAVLLSKHIDENMDYKDGYDVKKLRADIIGSTRVVAGANDYFNTGGIFDLSVKKENYCPSITDASVSGREITLSGYYFGDVQGTVEAETIQAGDSSSCETQITGWGDNEVKLSSKKELSGLLKVKLTAGNGRDYTFIKLVEKSSSVFEKELSLADEKDDPDDLNSIINNEAQGIMLGLDNKLFFLQETVERETLYFVQYLRIYDISKKKWKTVKLKEPLENVSAVIYKGKLLLEGGTVNVSDSGTCYPSEKSEERFYLYDTTKDKWKKVSTKNTALTVSLAKAGKKLYVVGNKESGNDSDEKPADCVCTYSTKKGAAKKPLAKTSRHMPSARVTSIGNHIYAYVWNIEKFGTYGRDMVYNFALQRVDVKKGKSSDLSKKLPGHFVSKSLVGIYNYTRNYSLATVKNGIVIAGPNDTTEQAKNVWFYNDKKNKMTPYKKQISDGNIMSAAVAAYKNRLYAIAMDARDGNKMVFRSTSIK